jgi:serine/threonine protein kinase/Flp pilus assembly protein TadD
MTSSQSPDYERLDLAWQDFYRAEGSKPEPTVREFLAPELEGKERLVALVSLIQVDQEYRWKPSSLLPNTVERREVGDYVAEWPELRRPDILLKLMLHELEYRSGEEQLSNAEILIRWGKLTGTHIEGSRRAQPSTPPTDAPSLPLHHVICKLDEGGQGNVWLAQRADGSEEAVKVLLGADPVALSRFAQEIKALKKLHENGGNPSIVRVLGSDFDNTPPYLAMEYCKEGSLKRLLDKRDGRPLDPHEAAKLAKHIALGLTLAHQGCITGETSERADDTTVASPWRPIIHRDIKPANILLVITTGEDFPQLREGQQTRFQPKLTDFGHAQLREGDSAPTLSGTILGTPSYMPPEQASGESRHVGPTADIYSAGAVLYECLTGRPPFKGANDQQTIQQLLNSELAGPRSLNADVPRDLAVICMKCLRKEPEKRYKSAGDLAADLQRFLDGQPIHARPISAREKVLRWFRRRPAIATALLAAVFFVAFATTAGVIWARARAVAENERVQRVATARAELLVSEQLRNESRSASRRMARQLTTQALAAAKRADGLLQDGDDHDLRGSIDRQVSELEMSERDQQLLIRLEEAWLRATAVGPDTPFDWGNVEEGILEAFDRYPLDVRGVPAERIIAALQDRQVKLDVAATFDLLGRVARNKSDRERYGSIAVQLDPDPVKNQIRKAIATADGGNEVERLCHQLDLRTQPLATLLLLGSYLLEAGNYKESELILRAAQNRFAGDFWANLQLSTCLFRTSPAQPTDALRFCTAAVALRSDSPGARSSLAAAFIAARRDAEAEREARLALELEPNLPEAQNNLAIALMRLYRMEEAETSARAAYLGRPRLAETRITLGLVLYRKGQYREAEKYIREALQMKPDAHTARGVLAGLMVVQRRIPEADKESQIALKHLPDRAEVLTIRAYVLMQFDKCAEAIEMLTRALALTPDFVDATFYLAFAYAMSGNPEKGEALCRTALESHSKNAEGHITLGVCLVLQKKRREAIGAFEKALEVCPEHPVAHQSLGQVYGELRNWAKAAEHHRRASELLPNWSLPFADLAVALAELGQWEEAEQADRNAIELDLDGPRPYEHLAFVLQTSYRLPEAEAALRDAIRRGDKKIDTHFRLLQVLGWLGKFSELPAACSRLQKLHPDNIDVQLRVSTFLAVAEEWKLAEDAIHKAQKLKPGSWEVREMHLGLLELGGRYEDAQALLKELQESSPKADPLQKQILAWKQRIDRKQHLDERLKAIDNGKPIPDSIREKIELARHAKGMSRKRYLLSLRLYKDAFQAQPTLENDMRVALRSEAAQAAALAACGLGDAKELVPKDRAEWHRQALDWLKADMASYKSKLKSLWPSEASSARESMDFWRQELSFAYVRGPDHILKLPKAEREAWEAFWKEVNTLLAVRSQSQ